MDERLPPEILEERRHHPGVKRPNHPILLVDDPDNEFLYYSLFPGSTDLGSHPDDNIVLDPDNVEPNSDQVRPCQATISYNSLEDRIILRLGAYPGAAVTCSGRNVPVDGTRVVLSHGNIITIGKHRLQLQVPAQMRRFLEPTPGSSHTIAPAPPNVKPKASPRRSASILIPDSSHQNRHPIVNDFQLKAQLGIDSYHTSGNVLARAITNHRTKSTSQRPIANSFHNRVIELSMPEGDSRPRVLVQVPSPFHPALANAQPCKNCKDTDSTCLYDISPDRAKTASGRPTASCVPCRARGRKCVNGIPNDPLKRIADEWNRSDPDGLGRYHSLKAGTVDENEDWVVVARELGENYPVEKGYTTPVKRKAGEQPEKSRQKRRMTVSGRNVAEERSHGEEPGGGHSQPSAVRSRPKRLSNASQHTLVAPDSSNIFHPFPALPPFAPRPAQRNTSPNNSDAQWNVGLSFHVGDSRASALVLLPKDAFEPCYLCKSEGIECRVDISPKRKTLANNSCVHCKMVHRACQPPIPQEVVESWKGAWKIVDPINFERLMAIDEGTVPAHEPWYLEALKLGELYPLTKDVRARKTIG